MKTLLFLSFLLVIGCATTRRYESMLDRWVGKDIHELYGKWGTPKRTFPIADGNLVHEYHSRNRFELEQPKGRFIAAEDSTTPVGCITQWISTPSGRIIAWKWDGPDCLQ